ncbi:MAG: hypothetical protein OEZ58_00215 [Gammaproteobacteria bacterium]|nr:hypothetical protein [Gammaproteobacteria bacterium]
MKRCNKIVMALLMVSNGAVANNGLLPDHLIKPKTCEFELEEITRLVVPIMPFRGVNLIFPFELLKTETMYSLSGNNIWNYKEAIDKGNIVPIYFKEFKKDLYGTVQDFSIVTGNYLVSIGLTAVNDPERHCTNVKLNLSDAEKQRIETQRKTNYKTILEQEYQEKYKALDQMAEDKALQLIGEIVVRDDYSRQRIKEEGFAKMVNGETVKAFVNEVLTYNNFRIIRLTIENESSKYPVNVENIQLKNEGAKGGGKAIVGTIDVPKYINANTTANMVFVTREALPVTSLKMLVKTDVGEIEVVW